MSKPRRPLVRWASIDEDGEVNVWERRADARPRMKSLDATTEIVRLVEAPRWVPVSERLPEPMTEVLIGLGSVLWLGWMQDGKWWIDTAPGMEEVVDVTHWMNLPEAPR